MRLEFLEPKGFGKFEGGRFELGPGFNLIYGDNEAGKSTLLTFIEFMLFGAKRDGAVKRYYLPEHSRYQPWSGSSYEGRMVFGLDGGRQIEVFRNFDAEKDSISIHDSRLGKDMTGQFPADRRGEILFVKELTGMTRSVFLHTVLVPQMALGKGFEKESVSELSAVLLKAVSGAGRDGSAKTALELLNNALEKIGKTDRGKRAAELITDIERLEQELTVTRGERTELAAAKEKFAELEEDYSTASRNFLTLQGARAHSRAAELRSAVVRHSDLSKRIQDEKKAIDEYSGFREFPLQNIEAVQRLEDQRSENRKAVETTEKKLKTVEGEVEELAGKLRELEAYRNLPGNAAESFIELKARWNQAEENVFVLRNQLETELVKGHQKRERFEELEELFDALGEDTGQRLEDLTQQEEEISEELYEMSEQVSAGNLKRGPQTALAMAFALLSGGSAFGALALSILDMTGFLAADFAWQVLLGISAVSLVSALLLRGRGGTLAKELKEISHRFQQKLEERKQLRKERATVFSLAGVKDYQGFLRLRSEYEALRDTVYDNSSLLQQKRLPQLEDEARKLREQMLAKLRFVGLAIYSDVPSEGEMKSYTENVRKVQALTEDFRRKNEFKKEIQSELDESRRKGDEVSSKLDAFYNEAGCRTYTEFVQRSEGRRALDKHIATLERLEENLAITLGGKQPDELQQELDQLEKQIAESSEEDKPSRPVSAAMLESAREKVISIRSELDTLRGNIEKMEESQRDPGLIELELETCRNELERIRNRRKSLLLAIEGMEEATEKMHADFAPVLNSRISSLAKSLTVGRYGEVMVGDDFSLSIRLPGSGRITGIDSLSSGARDQLYFAARIALADVLTKKGETLPLILDDSFVEYDGKRAKEAMGLLARMAKTRQIILLTCHNREVELAGVAFRDGFTSISLDA